MQEIILITPPFTQLNTPYPATAYLKGFLNTKNISSFQVDLGIEVILNLFSKEKLSSIFELSIKNNTAKSENAKRILALKELYLLYIEDVILFLQGKNNTFSHQIASEHILPEASKFSQLEELEWAFGSLGIHDKAIHLATLFLEDLGDFITECVDSNFGFSRYAEKLGRSANSFDELYTELQQKNTFIDDITIEILSKKITSSTKLICFSVPFPGNLYSAFRCAKWIKEKYPELKIALGGGFPNTELRSLKDKRVFDFFDFVCLDDGELPLELIYKSIINPEEKLILKRTYHLENNEVFYNNISLQKDYAQSQIGTPDYTDLFLDNYISTIEIANPMHSLWSYGRWNKLTMAHGCYWAKCTFCDISLSYIKDYEPLTAILLVDKMQEMISKTGEKGFHFVDEAAPPSLMKAMALEIIKRKMVVTWWANIRFEKSFTKDLCFLLKKSGCIAVSGGLEVASDRLLKLINKGVTVSQVANVCANFSENQIMVHAYLMYGYPTQTIQETIDSLEMVRQLFLLGIMQSGFWHQFALTAHSPIGLEPEKYNIIPQKKKITFADNDVVFKDNTNINHDQFSFGLKKSLYNFMHGVGLDFPLQQWFDFKIPKTTIAKNYIQQELESNKILENENAKMYWLGEMPTIFKTNNNCILKFYFSNHEIELIEEEQKAKWFLEILKSISLKENKQPITFKEFKSNFESQFSNFASFWDNENMHLIRENGLILI
ncbi:MAG: radical SAM protein [Chitinophagaceae bacterium]|nr:radical SAM protein [Chitinophagaceae bacterium]